MNNYADIEWSRKLGHLFPDAEWWYRYFDDERQPDIYSKDQTMGEELKLLRRHIHYPAISIAMALDKIPKMIDSNMFQISFLDKVIVGYVDYCQCPRIANIADDSLPNALCSMIEYLDKEGLL